MTAPEYARRTIRESVNAFLVPLTRKGLKSITLDNYREILYRDLWYLYEKGLPYLPSKITDTEVEVLIKDRWTGAPKYNHNRRSVFFRYLDYHGNPLIKEYPSPRYSSQSSTIGPDHWLTDEEAVAMYGACIGPVEKWVVHAELKLGLRRFDLQNVTRDDVYFGYIDVLGKGNKRSPVAFVGDTADVLQDLFLHLEEVTADVPDPPRDLLLYRTGSYRVRLGAYQKTALDDMIKRVAARAGITRNITNHMLRRTCARMWLRSGASIDEVSLMLRHTNTETTRVYLGLTVDDQKVAAMRFDEYFRRKQDLFRNGEFSQIISEPDKNVDSARFELAASTMPR